MRTLTSGARFKATLFLPRAGKALCVLYVAMQCGVRGGFGEKNNKIQITRARQRGKNREKTGKRAPVPTSKKYPRFMWSRARNPLQKFASVSQRARTVGESTNTCFRSDGDDGVHSYIYMYTPPRIILWRGRLFSHVTPYIFARESFAAVVVCVETRLQRQPHPHLSKALASLFLFSLAQKKKKKVS